MENYRAFTAKVTRIGASVWLESPTLTNATDATLLLSPFTISNQVGVRESVLRLQLAFLVSLLVTRTPGISFCSTGIGRAAIILRWVARPWACACVRSISLAAVRRARLTSGPRRMQPA